MVAQTHLSYGIRTLTTKSEVYCYLKAFLNTVGSVTIELVAAD
jgi:hypothetical protein